jgi:hypothetical protein
MMKCRPQAGNGLPPVTAPPGPLCAGRPAACHGPPGATQRRAAFRLSRPPGPASAGRPSACHVPRGQPAPGGLPPVTSPGASQRRAAFRLSRTSRSLATLGCLPTDPDFPNSLPFSLFPRSLPSLPSLTPHSLSRFRKDQRREQARQSQIGAPEGQRLRAEARSRSRRLAGSRRLLRLSAGTPTTHWCGTGPNLRRLRHEGGHVTDGFMTRRPESGPIMQAGRPVSAGYPVPSGRPVSAGCPSETASAALMPEATGSPVPGC